MHKVRCIALVPLLLAILGGCRLFTDTATLVVKNRSAFLINEVYITPHDTPWVDDLLSDTIPPGDSRAFPSLTPGSYDILIYDTDEGWEAWLGEVLAPWERHTIAFPH